MIPPNDMSRLIRSSHIEIRGYHSPYDDQFYCIFCELFGPRGFRPIAYHVVIPCPLDFPIDFLCFACSKSISVFTPLTACKNCFIQQLQKEFSNDTSVYAVI